MQKIAILGGTFDPVHWGHLLMAQTALSQAAIEQVIWVPTRCPPHKLATEFAHRLEMVREAIADHPGFIIAPFTKNDSDPTYASQTLTDLQAFYPNTYWYWIVGLDAFQTLPHWYRRQEICRACDWLVVPRGRAGGAGGAGEVVRQLGGQGIEIRWELLRMPLVDISSSLIRQYCRDRVSIRYLVPETVREYIATHNLYLADRTG